MPDVQIEGGELTANLEERVVSGMLLPYNELGQTNLGRFTVPQGAFKLPSDAGVLNANLDHDPRQPVAQTLGYTDTAAGIVGSWRIGRTPAGDELLAGIRNNDPEARRRLSIEVTGVKVKDGKATEGVIYGAAFVKRGAFPSAELLAALEEEEAPASSTEPTTTTEKFSDEFTDENGVTRKRTTTRTTTVDGDTTVIKETTVIEEPEQPAAEEEEATVPTATIPGNLAAAHTPPATNAGPDLSSVFELITQGRANQGQVAGELLAALADITTTSALGTGGTGNPIQPAWLGELWQGRSYERKYFGLIRNGSITAQDEKGFILTGTDNLVQKWGGNKTELPTGSAQTSLKDSIFQRWGWAADIAREWFDIPANRPIIEAFLRRLANSYARQTDLWLCEQLGAAATLLAPETYPTDYPGALGMLIQGIEAVEEAGDTPTFAIANPLAWRELLYTPKDKIPEFISFDFGTRGEGTADGRVKVVKGANGIVNTKAVTVGSSQAAHVNELPGASPMNLDALDIARGGMDRAIIGYTQFMADFPAALVKVGTADAGA